MGLPPKVHRILVSFDVIKDRELIERLRTMSLSTLQHSSGSMLSKVEASNGRSASVEQMVVA